MKPVKIKIVNKNLLIEWDDKNTSEINPLKLRINCPCATCITEREKLSKNYIPLFSENQVKISGITEVGSYALGLTFSDGHNTGIYEYTFLRNLAESADKI